MVNSEILKTLITPKISLNKIKESSLMNLNFGEFLERLENENFNELTNDNFKYIAQKIRKSIDNQNQQYNYYNFIQLVTRLPIEKLSFFKELIELNYNKFLNHSFDKNEINTLKGLKNLIESIPDNTHKKVADFVKQTKEKASNTITKVELLSQKQQELENKLLSLEKLDGIEYIFKVDYPEEGETETENKSNSSSQKLIDQLKYLKENFYLDDGIIARLKKKSEVVHKINLDGKSLTLSKENILNYLLEMVELKPELLVQKLHFSHDGRFHISKDLVDKYMKINPLSQSVLMDEVGVDFGENIHAAINIIHFNSWYEIREMKNPMGLPGKIKKLYISDENKLHIQKLHEELSNAD